LSKLQQQRDNALWTSKPQLAETSGERIGSMVAKQGTALNKSAEMRKALAQYPEKGPAEIARMLTAQHGVPFQRNAVSAIKTKLAHKPARARKPPTAVALKTPAQPPQARSTASAASKGVAAMVSNLQTYIQRLGKQDLHRLIDTL
jgi:hypothetical protein